MPNLNFAQHTHSDRLERWLGADAVQRVSDAMVPWYGPPIPLGGVPGAVYATKGGEFIGHCDAGHFGSAFDRAEDRIRRAFRNGNRRKAVWAAKQLVQANAGFASLSDLIAEASAGKKREIFWQKTGSTGVASAANSLWGAAGQPTVGLAGSAAPGGRAVDGSTTGAQFGLDNVSTDTRHFVSGNVFASTANQTLLMYDRIFDVAKTMSSTGTESVTGVPTRYQSSTATDPNYAGGNFCFPEVYALLGAGAHNWTVCQYRNQAGTDAQTFPSVTGNAAAIANRVDIGSTGQWFMPLATGDTGVMDLHQMQCSASITGSINFVIGHPIVFMPCIVANIACGVDGIMTAFNLHRVFDGAALSFLEMSKPNSTATAYSGNAVFVHG
jgi:hypothetical protein